MSSSYIKWKGLVLTSIVPRNSRPPSNSDNLTNYSSPFGKARPLKHWRKQLNPPLSSRSSRTTLARINAPGGSITRNSNSCLTCGEDNVAQIKTEIGKVLTSNCTYSRDDDGTCISKKIRRSASTTISPTYYTSNSGYLHSRGKTYNQKIKITSEDTDSSISNSYFVGNTNYKTCVDGGVTTYKKATTIYKPSNSGFAVQGAVSAGDRLTRLKYNTITRNGASFKSAFGSQAANAGRYHGSTAAPYFVKSKIDKCYKKYINC